MSLDIGNLRAVALAAKRLPDKSPRVLVEAVSPDLVLQCCDEIESLRAILARTLDLLERGDNPPWQGQFMSAARAALHPTKERDNA